MAQESAPLSLFLLGAPQLRLNGRQLDTVRRKSRALVFYLAAHNRPLTRAQLLTFFWPDHTRAAAQQVLRATLYDLRQHLGDHLHTDNESVALAADTFVDGRAFDAGLRPSADLQTLLAALALYRGDFLDGFALADDSQFDDWVVEERERYRQQAIRTWRRVAEQYEGRQQYGDALDAVQRALAFDSLQEEMQRDAMRLHYRNGDRAGAIRQFEGLRHLLDDEMGVPPMPETQNLYDAIITDRLPLPTFPLVGVSAPERVAAGPLEKPASTVHLLPFTGRASELQTLTSLATSGKLLLLVGEAGVGKTRLIEAFLAAYRPAQKALLVVRGVAYELENGLPFQPIIEALRGLLAQSEWQDWRGELEIAPVWLSEVARLLPELLNDFPQTPAPLLPADEARLWEGLHQLLLALARRQPLCLLIDDLHWADAATIGWLGYVARRTTIPGLLLLAATRPIDEQSRLCTLVQTLTLQERVARIPVAALSTADIRSLAAYLSPASADSLFAWLLQNSEGNPFFVAELVRHAYHNGLLQIDGRLDSALLTATPVLPPTIHNLIQSRLIRLSENARHILHIAAVSGREMEFDLVRHAAGMTELVALNAVEELRGAGLLVSTNGEQFSFDHNLTMQVAVEEMGEMRRRLWHRQVAETLERLNQPDLDPVAGRIARHFTEGRATERVAPHAFRAGQFAASLAAWVEAIAFYEQALACETADSRRAPIYLAVGMARFHKGDFAAATIGYRRAVELAQAHRDLDTLERAHLALNQSYMPQARYAEAIAVSTELRQFGPPELTISAEFAWGTALAVESMHPVEAEQHLRAAERLLAEQTIFRSQISSAQIEYQLANAVGQQGRNTEAIALYRSVLGKIDQQQVTFDLLRHIMLYNNLAYYHFLEGDPAAEGYVRAGIRLAQERGSLSHLPYLYSTSGEIALAQGDLESAEHFFSAGLSLAEDIPIPERIAGLTANLGLVDRQRGQMGLSRQRLSRALELADSLGIGYLGVRIRLWLVTLLPPVNARQMLAEARRLAEQNSYQRLLAEVAQIAERLPPEDTK